MNIAELERAPLRGRLRFDESAAKHSEWRIGGPIARFYEPASVDDLLRFLQILPSIDVVVWMGAGCNLLVRDGGFPGTVIAPRRAFDSIELVADSVVRAGSGVRLPKLARFCAQYGLSGAEAFHSWPHTVGGALQLCVSRGQQSLWPLVENVTTLDRYGESRTLSLPVLREQGLPSGAWLVAAQLRLMTYRGAPVRARTATSAGHGPLFRATQGREVHDLIRQAGLEGIRSGGIELAVDDANYVHVKKSALVSDVERLIVRIQDAVRAKLGVRLERQVQLLGRRQ
ncbi:MAG: FAD-binding protein [Gammaproteobacteria bacterium]|nr:FAD-binding protein [Gammaproteobacteria bacterium]